MKKLLFVFAALLLCFLAHSQEAEGTGSYAEFQVIPRFEFNPYFTPGRSGDGSSGSSFGNSSVYTLLEGAFSDHVSYTLSNHWFGPDPKPLYSGTLYSNCNNWLDIAKLDFTFGGFTITLGKDCMASGGFEYDAWDVDVDQLLIGETTLLASYLWYNLPSYQWGASVGYSFGEHTSLRAQMTTSPFGERPFVSGLYTYSLQWSGNYGPVSNIWSGSAVQRPDGGFEWLIALSQRAELGDFTLGFDWYNMVDVDYGIDGETPCEFIKGNTWRPSVSYAPVEQFDLALIGNIYTRMGGLYDLNLGTVFHYRPTEPVQLHAGFGWDLNTKACSAMFGIKVNFSVFSL